MTRSENTSKKTRSSRVAEPASVADRHSPASIPPVIEAEIVEPIEIPKERSRRPVPLQRAEEIKPPCPSCGTPRESDSRFCISCGAPLETPDDDDDTPVKKLAMPDHQFRCQTCGSEVSTSLDQVSYRCPFCDSTYVLELPNHSATDHAPEFIIGFAISPEKAADLFRKWLRQNSWFRPGDLSAKALLDKQRGVYLPFWHFSMGAESRWSAQIGEYWYRTETYTVRNSKGQTEVRTRQVRETEWWPLSGEHHQYYYGYLVPAGRSLSEEEARGIQPFQLASLVRYRPHYLAGWMCENECVKRDDAEQACRAEFLRREQQAISHFLPGDTQANLGVDTYLTTHDSDLVLLPIHILSYRYGENVFRFIVNGQTGKILGQKPISKRRVAAAIVVGLVLIVAVVIAVKWLAR
jgi:DNA-directed RNA polymerase subunit RPC12/RpoP